MFIIIIIDLAQVKLIYLEKASYLCVLKVAMLDTSPHFTTVNRWGT